MATQLVTGVSARTAWVEDAYTRIHGTAPSAADRAALVKKLQTGTTAEALLISLLAGAVSPA